MIVGELPLAEELRCRDVLRRPRRCHQLLADDPRRAPRRALPRARAVHDSQPASRPHSRAMATQVLLDRRGPRALAPRAGAIHGRLDPSTWAHLLLWGAADLAERHAALVLALSCGCSIDSRPESRSSRACLATPSSTPASPLSLLRSSRVCPGQVHWYPIGIPSGSCRGYIGILSGSYRDSDQIRSYREYDRIRSGRYLDPIGILHGPDPDSFGILIGSYRTPFGIIYRVRRQVVDDKFDCELPL